MVTLKRTGGDFRLTPTYPRTHTVHEDRLLLNVGVCHTVTPHVDRPPAQTLGGQQMKVWSPSRRELSRDHSLQPPMPPHPPRGQVSPQGQPSFLPVPLQGRASHSAWTFQRPGPPDLGQEQQPPGWGQAGVWARPPCSLKELKPRTSAWFAELGTGRTHLAGPLPNAPGAADSKGRARRLCTCVHFCSSAREGRGLEPCLAGKP